MGEVVFYVSGSEGSHYQCSQTVRCGGSAITCAAWLSNSRCVCIHPHSSLPMHTIEWVPYTNIQWNLRIMDMLRTSVLSIVQRLSLLWR